MVFFYKIVFWFTIIAALFVFLLKNPLYAALSLILTFIGVSTLMLFFDLEFLGLIFIMVYVGAIMVLFVFNIMSFNFKTLNHTNLTVPVSKYLNILKPQYFLIFNFFISVLLSSSLYSFLIKMNFNNLFIKKNYLYILANDLLDLDVFGLYLYTQTLFYFILIGIILLITLFGVVLLTLEENSFKIQTDFKTRNISSINVLK
jgi:NADH:ubiquinone oxidoreductase subunit 6 (subunit J)